MAEMVDKKETFDFLMGMVVLCVTGIFISVIYDATDHEISKQGYYTLRAEFKSSEGISAGSSVKVSDVQVGKVYKKVLDPNDYAALVFILVDNHIKLPVDTLAAISTDGVLGAAYVDLRPGMDKKMLDDNDEIIYTRDSINVSDMISKVSKFLNYSK